MDSQFLTPMVLIVIAFQLISISIIFAHLALSGCIAQPKLNAL
jgi:hypothetical protein